MTNKVSFGQDYWCSKAPLKHWILENFNLDWNLKVADVMKDWFWDINCLKKLVQKDAINVIFSIPILRLILWRIKSFGNSLQNGVFLSS